MAFIRKIRRNGKTYLAEVENYRSDGKVKQRHIKYLGLDPDSDLSHLSFCSSDLSVSSVKVHGPIIVLESIARELDLFNLLGNKISAPILTLVFAHCLDYKSVLETENWFKKTDLSTIMRVDKITSNQLYESLEELSKCDFEFIEKSIFEKLTDIFEQDESGVIYDGTNTHCLGSLSSLAKKGKDKEGVRGRKIIQIGLGVTKKLGLPIFHQVHEGNIHDTKMFNEAILKFNSMGVKSGLSVFDRGITSTECISKLTKLGWKCLAGLQNHKGVKSAISNLDFESMDNFKNMVIQGDTKFFVKSIPFQIGQTKGKLIILQNYLKKQKIKIERMASIDRARDLLNDRPELVDDTLLKYFNSNNKINIHAVNRAEKYDGLSFLFTNAKLNQKQAVEYYFAKDIVERCFRTAKSSLSLRPIRLVHDHKIRAHIMVCYIGLALLTTVRLRLNKAAIHTEPSAVLKSLETIFKVYLIGTKTKGNLRFPFTKVNTLSNTQKKLIKIIAPNIEM